MRRALVLLLLLPASAAAQLHDPAHLLVYRGANGQLLPVKTVADWEQRRTAILRTMQDLMGPFPGPDRRCPLDVQVEEEVDCGAYVRRRIRYQAEPGGDVPAYLLIPKAA